MSRWCFAKRPRNCEMAAFNNCCWSAHKMAMRLISVCASTLPNEDCHCFVNACGAHAAHAMHKSWSWEGGDSLQFSFRLSPYSRARGPKPGPEAEGGLPGQHTAENTAEPATHAPRRRASSASPAGQNNISAKCPGHSWATGPLNATCGYDRCRMAWGPCGTVANLPKKSRCNMRGAINMTVQHGNKWPS